MQKPDTLIRTKLYLPFVRSELVSRPHLQEKIKSGLQCPLTLITAPAGFGKTTLVASCFTSFGLPIAWLSLDKDDNRTGRFLNYLVASLQAATNVIGLDTVQLLDSPQPVPSETILISLINDLLTTSGEIILVLDDYQFISNQTVHDNVSFLIDHCPKNLHLVIATRSDPPLPFARLRARNQIVELRAADLRFSELEATQFLKDVMGLQLDERSITILEERTEGWIAGLQMAALSLRDRKDIIGFIEGFSGTNRYILEYLLTEILAMQPPEIQRFLLYTSILERLTAPLCDVLLNFDEQNHPTSYDRTLNSKLLIRQQSATILEYLERANLFLVPLDDERNWFRYHHLFADLLRTQLQRSPKDIAQLYIRASEWHEQNGLILDAINYAITALDGERVERLIVQNYMNLLGRGEMSWMRFWTSKLSEELIYQRPLLCIYLAQSHAWFGELDEADLLLDNAEKRIRSESLVPAELPMLGHLDYVRSRVIAMKGDYGRAIKLCLSALDNTPISNLAMQIGINVALGYEYFLSGDFENAIKTLNKTVRLGHTAKDINPSVAAYCVLARLYAVQGLLSKAFATFPVAIQLFPETSGQHLGAKALVEIGIAEILYEWNDLEAALTHLKLGLAQMPLWGKADDLALAFTTLARIHLAQGKWYESMEVAEKASQLIQNRGIFSEARNAVEITWVKLWLAHEDLRAASRWAASLEEPLRLDEPFGFENELTRITQARVWIAQNKFKKASDLLSDLEESARRAGRIGRLLEILLLETCALQKMDPEHAMLALTECLTLAEPGGYVRIFLDEGQPMRLLLAVWLAQAGGGPVREHAIHLLSQFSTEPQVATAAKEAVQSFGKLVEPLSRRELEVLHLMALGRTNLQIAEQLIVARGTIKAHTASIYRKLDVANRTEAVARARQLFIIP